MILHGEAVASTVSKVGWVRGSCLSGGCVHSTDMIEESVTILVRINIGGSKGVRKGRSEN